MRSLFYLNKYFAKYKWRLILGVFFIICSNLFAVYTPQIIQEAVDFMTFSGKNLSVNNFSPISEDKQPRAIQVFNSIFNTDYLKLDIGNKDALLEVMFKTGLFLALLYLAVYLLKGIFLFLTRQTIIIMSRLIEFDLKNEIYDHYQTLSTAFYKRNNTGDLMNRISEDVSKVRMYLGPAMMYTINLCVIFILAILAMISISPELTLYVLTPLPIMSVIIYYVSSIINKKSEAVQSQQSWLSTMVQENISGIRVLKAYQREENAQMKFNEASEEYKKRSLKLVKVNALFMPTIISLISFSTILTIFLGGKMLINGQGGISHGDIVAFVFYINMLTWPFASVGWVTSLVQRAAASQKRINEFLHESSEISISSNPREVSLENIVFKNVSFVYPDTGIKALNDVSFSINKGETVAMIGATGSGKTTIASLLLRQYDVTSGKILVDGTDIRQANLDNMRDKIGYVPQDVFLFSDTIENNIVFGSKFGHDNNDIEKAAQMADVLKNINQFPDKFKTILGERGITLSGGQKQRVSIARAILKNPDLLIFDDSLSAVDTQTEEKILSNLREVMKEKTILIFSHRVSTIMSADKILVLDEGKIVESGDHQDLLSLNGIYARLYQKQLWEERKVMAS